MADEIIEPEHESHEVPQDVESNVVSGAEVVPQHVEVKCQGCQQAFGFDIDNTVDGFVFICSVCKTQSAWTRG